MAPIMSPVSTFHGAAAFHSRHLLVLVPHEVATVLVDTRLGSSQRSSQLAAV